MGETLSLRVHEGPNLIDLDTLTGEVLENAVLVGVGRVAGVPHEFRNRGFTSAGEPGGDANPHAFAETPQNEGLLLRGQAIRARNILTEMLALQG